MRNGFQLAAAVLFENGENRGKDLIIKWSLYIDYRQRGYGLEVNQESKSSIYNTFYQHLLTQRGHRQQNQAAVSELPVESMMFHTHFP